MVWFIFTFIIMFFIFLKFYTRGSFVSSFDDKLFAFLTAFIVACSIGMVASITIGGLLPVTEYSFDVPLIQIKTVNGESGNFFLGTGNIDATEYYFYYYKNDDGSVSGDKTEANPCVKIYENNNTPPKITFYYNEYNSKWIQKHYIWVALPAANVAAGTNYYCPTITVPSNSIEPNFSF